MKQGNWIYTMTKIVGLLGGLTMILGIAIPLMVKAIRDRKLPKNKPKILLSAKIRQLIHHIFQRCINLNLFDNRSENAFHTRRQRIATRTYLMILLVVFVILFLYLSVKQEIHHGIINRPTESQYTQLKGSHSASLVCPCTHLSQTHEQFLTITPIYHPICSSAFTSSPWIDLMSRARVLSDDEVGYRASPGTYFSMLATLCKYARKMVNDSVGVFLQTQFISSQLIEQRIFDSQMYALTGEWILNTVNNFRRTLELIQETNQGNKLISDMFNINPRLDFTTEEVIYDVLTYSDCPCNLFGSCSMPLPACAVLSSARILRRFIVPEFFIGCYPVEALLKSKLVCFYNQTCFEEIVRPLAHPDFYPEWYNQSHTLNISDSQPDDTLQTIVNKLMITAWNPNVSFSLYYNACAPSVCTFEYTARSSIVITMITMITILGGLSTGLKICFIIMLRIIESLTDLQPQNKFRQLMKRTFTCNSENKLTDRLHILFLVATLIILYLIAFLNRQTMTGEVMKPSLTDYEDLFQKYSTTLRCSCKDISFKYRTFVTLEPTFHPICSSNFISNEWIMHVYQTDFYSQTKTLGQHQLLVSLCHLVKKTVSDGLAQFNGSDYISAELKSFTVLNRQIQSTLDDFQSRVSQSFLGTLNLIRETTAVNMLMNIYSSNWKYQSIPLIDDTAYRHTEPIIYEGCNCGLSSNCSLQTQTMMIGCYPLEALLQSTLQCFYDQQCIDPSETFKALNSSLMSNRFYLNSTIESILQQMMVEEYRMNISYEQYYAQCLPSVCQYSYLSYGDTLDIIIALIGLYGGLVIIARCSAVLMVSLYQCSKQRPIHPEVQ